MKSYVKILGPPLLDAIRALDKIAVDMKEVCVMNPLIQLAPYDSFTSDEAVIRHVFERVHEIFDEIVGERICGPDFRLLSLGMSNDFEYAIEAGATHVRIGTALFEGIQLGPQTVPVK